MGNRGMQSSFWWMTSQTVARRPSGLRRHEAFPTGQDGEKQAFESAILFVQCT